MASLYILGIPLTILTSIILARTLTVKDFGEFGFVISLATILSIPVAAGLPALVTREVAAYVANSNWPSYRGIATYAHGWVLLFTGVIAIAIFGWISASAGVGKKALLFSLAIIPFIGLTAVRTGILRGLKHPIMADVPAQIAQPLLLIVGYLGLAHFGLSSVQTTLSWYIVVAAILFVAATFLLVSVQPAEVAHATVSAQEMRRWLRALPPFAMIGAFAALNAHIAIVLLGVADLNEEVAFMRVAERGAHLVVFPLYFAGSVLAPIIVELEQSGDRQKLRRVARYSSRLAFALSLPIALVLAVFGTEIIAFTFGTIYADAAFAPMIILVLAQTVAAALGTSSLLLAMSHNEKLALLGQLAGLCVLLIVALPLIGEFGAIGASISAAAGLLSNRIMDFVAVRLKLGFWPGIL